jgi:hypothetical protein
MTLPDCMLPDGAEPCRGFLELQAENARLREALAECADDLAAELNGRYGSTLDHPSQKARWERDMAPVIAARRLLAPN